MRTSGLANDFQKGKNLIFRATALPLGKKYHLKKELVSGSEILNR